MKFEQDLTTIIMRYGDLMANVLFTGELTWSLIKFEFVSDTDLEVFFELIRHRSSPKSFRTKGESRYVA